MIRIVDSGKGIDPQFLPQIFDRFSQEDSSTIRVHGGLGLGLAIVRDLVELHGGTIRAESLGENRGASFSVMLPIKSDHPLSDTQRILKDPQAVDDKPVNLDGIRVLIVDDEADAREAFGVLLSSFGADVKAAGSATEALNIFAKFKPHVLISDIAMPEEDGYSLIKKVRALEKAAGGRTPALAMTAYAGEEDVRHALSAGFQVHLSKPVDGHHLAKTNAMLVGKRAKLVQ
jgi:CheY-like chemotaxis protein